MAREPGSPTLERPSPRFFLAEAPSEARPGRLLPEDAEHARRTLRLGPGARIVGLDGAGGRWPLVVRGVERDEVTVALGGEPEREPAAGEPGSPLPWIELAVAWPRKARAEGMIGPLTQLGAAAITPLDARWRGEGPAPHRADERWLRLAREACKQSGRAWLPVLGGAATPAELLEERTASPIAVLDPHRGMAFDTWVRSLVPVCGAGPGTRERPIVLAVGPEGGFAPEELELFHLRGATSVRLAPHVLRVEVAAIAALAVAVCAWTA